MHIALNLPIQCAHNARTDSTTATEKCSVNKWIHFVELAIIQLVHAYPVILAIL